MKKQPHLIAALLILLFVGLAGCKKDEPEPDPEPELTETERLLTTKKWNFKQSISYGAFDIDNDTILAGSDTTITTRANRHFEFELDGNAGYFDTAADTMTVEYRYTLNEAQTEMRLWEPASVISWQLYTDYDYNIVALDENNLVLKGDSKRRLMEASNDRYYITQLEFTAL